MEDRKWGDFDLSELESEESEVPQTKAEQEQAQTKAEQEQKRIKVIGVTNTIPGEVILSPEGMLAIKKTKDKDGNWVRSEYVLDSSAKALRVVGYSHLVYADVKPTGVEVKVGDDLAFSVRASSQVTSSTSGHTIELSGWDKRAIGYDPLEGEVVQRVGILTHVYATDGENLYIIEVKRGNIPSFGAYTSTMSGEARQVWDAYTAYVNVLREPTKERIDALMSALAPFPEILKKAEESFRGEVGGVEFANVSRLDKEAFKEKVGTALRELSKGYHRKYMYDFISENPSAIFASTQEGKRILRSGGMLTGSIAVTDKEVPVVITIGTTIVPAQEGVREGVLVLNMITADAQKGECNLYTNGFQRQVLIRARDVKNEPTSKSKLYSFLDKAGSQEYQKVYQSLKEENRQPISPSGAIAFVKENQLMEVDQHIISLAKLYGDAFGGFREVSQDYVAVVQEKLKDAVHRTSSPAVRAGDRARQEEFIDSAVREFEQDQTEENKRRTSFRQGN